MKTALLLVPETNDSINRQEYISACIQRVLSEGFNPLTPNVYELYMEIDVREFILQAITKPDMDTVFLFIDFGIDKLMFDTIDRCVRQKINLKYCRIKQQDMDGFFKNPFQVLRDLSRRTGFTVEQLQSKTRDRSIVDARFVYFRRCREVTKSSLKDIGLPVGKDHASVLHGIKEAYNTEQVVKLYNRYYGKAEAKAAPVDEEKREAIRDDRPVEGPVLSYRQVEAREPAVQRKESLVCTMSVGWAGNAFSGYRPHNS